MRERLRAFISQFVHEYSRTRRLETPWGEPLVGYASAIDPLFPYLQSAVSATHRMPRSLVKDARTVIVYFIPFSKMTVQSNVQGRQCSREWAVAYLETNKLIIELNQSLVHTLLQSRFAATSLSPTHNFDEQHLMSDWLHKHVALIAGLGTFGLHRMLITEKGCCGRLGSVITTAEITPSEKPERAFCLYYDDKSCQRCIENCVFGALSVTSFDRHRCYDICLSNAKIHSELGFADACGKCICVTPCSLNNPVR